MNPLRRQESNSSVIRCMENQKVSQMSFGFKKFHVTSAGSHELSLTGRFRKMSDALANRNWRERKHNSRTVYHAAMRPGHTPAMDRSRAAPRGPLFAKQSIPIRLSLLVAGVVLPLTIFAAVLVYYNYEANRRTAYDRILQIARGVATNVDAEFRAAIASLEVLALSEALERDDLVTFRQQAEHFVKLHFPQSNVVVSDASGQQLLNTAVPAGTPLPKYIRMEDLRRVFEEHDPQISRLLFGPVLHRNIVVVDVPVWRDGQVVYDLAASLPLSVFGDIIMRQRAQPDWTIAVFDREGTVIARSRDNQQFVGRSASPSLYPGLTNRFEGTLDTTTFDGTVVLTGFTHAQFSGWSAAVGIPRSSLTTELWRSVAVLAAIGLVCWGFGMLFAVRLATQLARSQADRELLINELNHRVKNTLATVQGLVASTLRSAGSIVDAKKVTEQRIIALGRAHDVLTKEHWGSADLRELVLSIVQPYRTEHTNSIEVFGGDLRVNPRAAVALAMVLNELMTNAAKYGALSQPEGRVRVEWSATEGRSSPKMRLVWTEMGGPLVQPPIRRGFGSTLIEQSITRELGGTFERYFDPAGLRCTITLPLELLTAKTPK
jgi:two-component sensor histidine kinase